MGSATDLKEKMRNVVVIASLIACFLGFAPISEARKGFSNKQSEGVMPAVAPQMVRSAPDPSQGAESTSAATSDGAKSTDEMPKRATTQMRLEIPSAKLEGNVHHFDASEGVSETGPGGLLRNAPLERMPRPRFVPPSIYKAWLAKVHPELGVVDRNMQTTILEVKGRWDKADRTLDAFGIPHTTIGAGELRKRSLDGVSVIIVNCPGNLNLEETQIIRNFVINGGYLLTTDWALQNLLERAFPGRVSWNKGKSAGVVVDATVLEPELFAGAVTNSCWKLDIESQTLRVLDPSTVRVLAQSSGLTKWDPDKKGILAVCFKFGRGTVLHLVGHFEDNSISLFPNLLPDPSPVIGIGLRQALAANFIMEGVSRYLRRK